MFAEVFDACDWQAVLDYAERATAAGTLLVGSGNAQLFVFDPVHHHDRAAVALRPLSFLVGHFRGRGSYSGKGGSFEKEVVGSWEAGGRFIGLRMSVTYPLDDGRNDVHHALVLVGHDNAAGTYHARAYTDGGTIHDYSLAVESDRVVFADRVPAHVAAALARKTLMRSDGGYREIVEIQPQAGPFATYSTLELRSVTDGAVTQQEDRR